MSLYVCYSKTKQVDKDHCRCAQEINFISAKPYFGHHGGATKVKFRPGAALLNPPRHIASPTQTPEKKFVRSKTGILRREASGTLARTKNDLRGLLASVTSLLPSVIRLLNKFQKCVAKCHPVFSRQRAPATELGASLDTRDFDNSADVLGSLQEPSRVNIRHHGRRLHPPRKPFDLGLCRGNQRRCR